MFRLTLPEDYGVEIEASVLFGRIRIFLENKISGMMNKLVWRTPGYRIPVNIKQNL